MPRVSGAGVELSYCERGSGRPLLLVHGMADGAAGWEPVAGALAATARVIAYDRRGYGGSDAPEGYRRTSVEEHAEDAACLLQALADEPAVVAGADFGALVCLDLLKRHRALAIAAAVVRPPLFAASHAATEALAAERQALEQAVRDEGPGGGPAAWLTARGAPEAVVDRARRHPRAFFADYGAQAAWGFDRATLRRLDAPVAVLAGERAFPHEREAADWLADLLPRGRREREDDPVPALRALLAEGLPATG